MTALVLKDVTKVFQDGDREISALQPTNFSVEPGEFVAIIGPSGSGKSTFLTIAGGLQTPSSGEVLVGTAIQQPFRKRKSKIALP